MSGARFLAQWRPVRDWTKTLNLCDAYYIHYRNASNLRTATPWSVCMGNWFHCTWTINETLWRIFTEFWLTMYVSSLMISMQSHYRLNTRRRSPDACTRRPVKDRPVYECASSAKSLRQSLDDFIWKSDSVGVDEVWKTFLIRWLANLCIAIVTSVSCERFYQFGLWPTASKSRWQAAMKWVR